MLETLATLVSLAAVAVSFAVYLVSRWQQHREVRRLETHLAAERNNPRYEGDTGKRSVNHLMRELGMSEEKILRLSTLSRRVIRSSRKRDDGMSGEVLFEHAEVKDG